MAIVGVNTLRSDDTEAIWCESSDVPSLGSSCTCRQHLGEGVAEISAAIRRPVGRDSLRGTETANRSTPSREQMGPPTFRRCAPDGRPPAHPPVRRQHERLGCRHPLAALFGLEHEAIAFLEVDPLDRRRPVRIRERDGTLEDVGVLLVVRTRGIGPGDIEEITPPIRSARVYLSRRIARFDDILNKEGPFVVSVDRGARCVERGT